MKKFLIATALVATMSAPVKAGELEDVIGGAAYLTLYAANCGTLPAKTKKMVETIILEVPDEVLVKAMNFDRQRKTIGNGAFCGLMRKNFAGVL